MSDATTKAKDGFGLKAGVIGAVVVIGGVGIAIGRWSAHSSAPPEPETTSGVAAAGSSSGDPGSGPVGSPTGRPPSSPAPAASDGPQVFDTTEDPNWKAGIPQRDMDRDIFAQMKNDKLERTQLLDLFPDRPYKVRLVGSVAEHRFGLVMIDLNRDGKWDERWDLHAGQIKRVVEHDEGADGQRVEYTMVRGKWQAH